ncbi:Alpha/Beta hydrolase protein [Terfezia claveryi]|nr:Alpha/Beta hydrolase protein [Terfezia claveryi]
MAIEPFKINVPDEFLDLTNKKFNLTRFVEPEIVQPEGKEWDDGTPSKVVEELVEYWNSGKFNWRYWEAQINEKLPQYTTPIDVDGFGTLKIHFVWIRSPRADAVPLILCHGWPGSFYELSKVLMSLSNPEDSSLQAFHCVAPSIPGYGFSEGPKKPGFRLSCVAETYDKLMKRLGYKHYVAHGGDWGYGIIRALSLLPNPSVLAIHSTWSIIGPPSFLKQPFQWAYMMLGFITGGAVGLSKQYCDRLMAAQKFSKNETGYLQIQSTRPLSLAWAMTDSPVGLLAWMTEKLKIWTDDYPWTPDEIFIWWMMYWYKGPYSSFRLYKEGLYDMSFQQAYSSVPMGISCFPKELVRIPPWWMGRLHPIRSIKEHHKGGHFAAWENPDAIVGDLREYFTTIVAEREELRAPRLNE